MNKISKATRRNIIDTIKVEGIIWYGCLNDIDFLTRLYDLNTMNSTDNRFKDADSDIRQHRVYNFDWDDDWIFTDNRFNLMHCEDETFLKFICLMLHPLVREYESEVSKLLQLFNECLSHDNFELVEEKRISNRPIFIGRHKAIRMGLFEKSNKEIIDYLSDEYVIKQTEIMENAIENSPELAIGTAKELIETICYTILKERNIETEKNLDLLKLLKQTYNQLNLTPDGVSDKAKASGSIKKILGSLATIVQGIGELRNHYGSGHGKEAKFKGLSARHAKLTVGSASTLAIFLIETHKEKN